MIHKRAKGQGQRSLGSRVKSEKQTEAIAFTLRVNAVGKTH